MDELNNIEKKDYLLIASLYNRFLDNYKNLINNLDLNNPIEIYIVFKYLLSRGYLSKDFNFKKGDLPYLECRELLGSQIFSGKGNCKHTSFMLYNIFRKCNNISFPILCNEKKYRLIKKGVPGEMNVEETKYWIEKNIFTVEQQLEYEMFIDSLLYKNQKLEIDKKKIFNPSIADYRYKFNHAITYVFMNGKGYYLDIVNSRILTNNNGSLSNGIIDDIKIAPKITLEFNTNIDIDEIAKQLKNITAEEIKKNLQNPGNNVTKDEEEYYCRKGLNLCKKNINYLNAFHYENEKIYEEASDTMDKIYSLNKINK